MRRTGLLLVLALVAGCSGVAAPDGSVRLDVGPADAAADVPVRIAVSGLDPGSEVVLWARRVDGTGQAWLARAAFTADPAGRVDVPRTAPESGTYSGVDGMGLFWSARPADGAVPESPFPPVEDALVTVTAQVGGTTAATATALRRAGAPDVVEERAGGGAVGVLHRPPGPGPHPGVVVLSGSEGGVPDYGVGELLASHGFTALSLGYFGAAGLPPELVRVPLETVGSAIDGLAARPDVADGPVGLVGVSRGGELALLAGAMFPQVGAVVSYNGSGFGGMGLPASGFGSVVPAWTLGGRDVPFLVPSVDGAAATAGGVLPFLLGAPLPDLAGTWADVERAGPDALATAEIPVERIAGPVLLLSGADDRLWPSPEMADATLRRLETRGHPFAHEHLSFPGAGHFFSGPPYGGPFPTVLRSGWGMADFGGTPEGNAAAAAAAWPRVLETLRAGSVAR